jgi:peptide/nickel transport system substrate-binding protein
LLDRLTIGILPKHQYQDITIDKLRELFYETLPVGSGPYRLTGYISEDGSHLFNLAANPKYRAGQAQIPSIQVRSFTNSAELAKAVSNSDVNAAVGLNRADATKVTDANSALRLTSVTLQDGVMALFNTSSPLFSQPALREALRLAVDRDKVRDSVAVDGAAPPALDGPTYGDFSTKQPVWNAATAGNKLQELGWYLRGDSRFNGEGQPLELNLVVSSDTDYTSVAEVIAGDWRAIGVKVNIQYVDARQLQSNYLVPRAYDVLLTQLKFGASDDFSAYWHSSNTGPAGTNYSNYSSSLVDLAINSAQTTRVLADRQARYEAIVKQWITDTPAIALYSPQLYYVANDNIGSLKENSVLIDADWRFTGVLDWTVLKSLTYKTL